MLSRAYFNQYAMVEFARSHARLLRVLGRVPYRPLHKAIVLATWLETWLRWPLKTLKMLDGLEENFTLLDPEGTRFGLTKAAREAFRKNRLYHEVADLFVLLNGLDKVSFRRRALDVQCGEVLLREYRKGPGALVVGFRLGAYPVIPLALSSLGHEVSMIVGSDRLAEMGRTLGDDFAPRSAGRVRYLSAQDRLVLARCLDDLKQGRIVSTLMELSPRKHAKTTGVRFLGWDDVRVPYGIPYLAAMTGLKMIPAVLTRGSGPRFTLRFLDPLPAPDRNKASILQSTQDLYASLEEQVRKCPDQWVGWTLLKSHLGIDIPQGPDAGAMPALS